MGCYGIGVSRLMQACIEARHVDKTYPDWPLDIAPYQIGILPAKSGSKFEEKSNRLVPYICEMLENNPMFKDDVLVDDRTWMTIGSRIIDAKLIGVPFLLVLGKTIEDEQIEIVINSPNIAKKLDKTTVNCHSRETAHVLKQLINDYLYAKKQSKIASYFS
jgi:prolyl-tRNA synthetase